MSQESPFIHGDGSTLTLSNFPKNSILQESQTLSTSSTDPLPTPSRFLKECGEFPLQTPGLLTSSLTIESFNPFEATFAAQTPVTETPNAPTLNNSNAQAAEKENVEDNSQQQQEQETRSSLTSTDNAVPQEQSNPRHSMEQSQAQTTTSSVLSTNATNATMDSSSLPQNHPAQYGTRYSTGSRESSRSKSQSVQPSDAESLYSVKEEISFDKVSQYEPSQNSAVSTPYSGNTQREDSQYGNGSTSEKQPPKKKRRTTKKGKRGNSANVEQSAASGDGDNNSNIDGGDENIEDEEERRKRFLERNRIAASKCRQKKKAWMAQLEGQAESLTDQNKQLLSIASQLRDEIITLRSQLLIHKNCGNGCNMVADYLSFCPPQQQHHTSLLTLPSVVPAPPLPEVLLNDKDDMDFPMDMSMDFAGMNGDVTATGQGRSESGSTVSGSGTAANINGTGNLSFDNGLGYTAQVAMPVAMAVPQALVNRPQMNPAVIDSESIQSHAMSQIPSTTTNSGAITNYVSLANTSNNSAAIANFVSLPNTSASNLATTLSSSPTSTDDTISSQRQQTGLSDSKSQSSAPTNLTDSNGSAVQFGAPNSTSIPTQIPQSLTDPQISNPVQALHQLSQISQTALDHSRPPPASYQMSSQPQSNGNVQNQPSMTSVHSISAMQQPYHQGNGQFSQPYPVAVSGTYSNLQ
ncbi:hypothetical protein BKA69DRAFT_1121615 [Paraphysoderma sedebokerense]|nr:hypothetical protein BKA69DRAFT_1121615 [Paraphysoderma sedebokerense]